MSTIADLARVERELRDIDYTRQHANTIAAFIAAQGWRSIETAPRHTPILMLMKYGAIEGAWDGETGGGYYWQYLEWFPTHWMPLPAPPKENTNG